MAKIRFSLVARVSTENPKAIEQVLETLVPKGSITPMEDGFLVKAELSGTNSRELNRTFLSALRRVERKTRLRAEWTAGKTVGRYFDYVPKGTRSPVKRS